MLNYAKSLTSKNKRTILLGIDVLLVPVALLLSYQLLSLPAGAWDMFAQFSTALPYLLVAAGGLSIWLGIPSIRPTVYQGRSMMLSGALAASVACIAAALGALVGVELPLGASVLFGLVYWSLSVSTRVVVGQIVFALYRFGASRSRVLIYGAGATGTKLAQALQMENDIEPVAFLDDDKVWHGLSVSGLRVYAPIEVERLKRDLQIDQVHIAVPSMSAAKQAQLGRQFGEIGLEVQTVPSFAQIISQRKIANVLEPLTPSGFLGREEVDANLGSTSEIYKGQVVLVSGAGGSIGSEICRQLMESMPAKLVLFELSELSLYTIDMELRPIAARLGIELVPVLGSVTEARQVREVLEKHAVQVILHAAAYKHVPLVEANPLVGIANNVFGTQTLVSCAAQAGVKRFILVSSDKAVRPTSVMGASKRLAELVVQHQAQRSTVHDGKQGMICAMVRFGNVLGSSGSVLPLFQDQIRRGGPVTVTDPGVARYFMTPAEAVRLVLTSGAMAKGGEVFILDMGQPIPIVTLAKQAIEAAGYSVRDADHPNGDIEITFTGLRPGEKLEEELTIGADLTTTEHRKIFYAREANLAPMELLALMRSLREALVAGDQEAARRLLQDYVGYQTESKENPLHPLQLFAIN